jgi:16S rRNA (adenine1518-N6/adenine1519-N6)-dimethyltransferase
MPQKLGQHFLIKGKVLDRIARAACPEREELVIEIGPGRGALTQKLLERADRVVAIELDPELADYLREKFADEPRLEVVEGDVLETSVTRWGPAALAGNLPYYVATPIIGMTLRAQFRRAVYLIQKEVAERLVASPGSREYGYLTVEAALFAETNLLFEVKPSAFHPPPKVDSAVVQFAPRPQTAVPDAAEFLQFVSRAFQHKRKTLRNNLAEFYGRDVVDRWPEAGMRAEQLSLETFVELFRRVVPQAS